MTPPGPSPGSAPLLGPPARRALEALGAAALALLLLVFLYAPLQDPDLWWHLESGAHILRERAVPRANTFSQAAAHPWIDHQWLYQVLLQGLWAVAGPAGVIGLRMTAVGACWLLLARIATPPGGFLALLPFLALGAVASNERMIDRPEILSCLFLAAALALLLRWRRRPGGGALVALLALQLLWANLHGGLAVLGVAATGAFFLGEAAQRSGPRPPLRGLGLAFFTALAALAATPYGLDGALHPLQLLRQLDSPAVSIAEFQGAFSDFRVTAAIVAFRVLLVLVLGILALSLPRIDLSLAILSLLTLALAASARRNIPFFVIAALPLVGAQIPVLRARLGGLRRAVPARRALAAAASLAVVSCIVLVARDAAGGRFYERDGRIKRLGGGIDDGAILGGTMDYLLRSDLPGPVFNDIDSGGYFIWRAYPQRLAFIDSRLEAQPAARLAAYDRAIRTAAGWDALDASARFGTVVIDHAIPLHGPFIERLARDPDWALLHLDAKGAVFTRRSAAPPGLLASEELGARRRPPAPYRAGPPRPDRPAAILRSLLLAREAPDLRAPLAYARVLLRLGFPDRAGEAVLAALARGPRSPDALVLAGVVAEHLGNLEEARRRYAQALAADPGCVEARFNLRRLPGGGAEQAEAAAD